MSKKSKRLSVGLGLFLVFALAGLSLTILTGWAGQLSLGQMAFAGDRKSVV